MKIYTRTGDDGSTGLFYGGRVSKDDTGPEAYGAVDEAVSALGVARALAEGHMAEAILGVQRDLFAVAAELATAADNRSKLKPGQSLATPEMVAALEAAIDRVEDESGLPTEFVVPGATRWRRRSTWHGPWSAAERRAVTHLREAGIEGSHAVHYLNRLADYLCALARAAEGEWIPSKEQT